MGGIYYHIKHLVVTFHFYMHLTVTSCFILKEIAAKCNVHCLIVFSLWLMTMLMISFQL